MKGAQFLILGALFLAVICCGCSPGPQVDTAYGSLEGVIQEGLAVFKGIPYAAPPVGELRFHPPVPPEPWSEVRPAKEFGCICAQEPLTSGMLSLLLGQFEPVSEDCLFLNVWTPAPDDAKRPVMVWVHGGALMLGSGSQRMYHGGNLAAKGDVVVVTLNYRLGILGNLAHQAIVDPETGYFANWGLLDVIAALQWVKDNIAAFGGDPDNVTLFGESAGGWSVSALMTTPMTNGLINRVIVESGPPTMRSLDQAKADAEEFFDLVGCPDGNLTCLRNLSFQQVVRADQAFPDVIQGFLSRLFLEETDRNWLFDFNVLIVEDGQLFPQSVKDAIASGQTSDLELVIGTTKDEVDVGGLAGLLLFSRDRIVDFVSGIVPGTQPDGTLKAEVLLSAYEQALVDLGEPADSLAALGNIITDTVFRIQSIKFAEMHKAAGGATHMYQFTYPVFLNGTFGALHASEIPFVFGFEGFHSIIDLSNYAVLAYLQDEVQGAWISFAEDGDPGTATLDWPEYDTTERLSMSFGSETSVVSAPEERERAAWEEVGAEFYSY